VHSSNRVYKLAHNDILNFGRYGETWGTAACNRQPSCWQKWTLPLELL
jgi:hypothetical protein